MLLPSFLPMTGVLLLFILLLVPKKKASKGKAAEKGKSGYVFVSV